MIQFGKTATEFLSNLEAVFGRFVKYYEWLKPSKCSFGFDKVEFVEIYLARWVTTCQMLER
jgi:hypothetical protein